jgi:hypothetical protein
LIFSGGLSGKQNSVSGKGCFYTFSGNMQYVISNAVSGIVIAKAKPEAIHAVLMFWIASLRSQRTVLRIKF